MADKIKVSDAMASKIKLKIVHKMDRMLDDIAKYPVKGSYNSLTNSYGKTQRDILNEFKSWAKTANLVYKAVGGSDTDLYDSIKEMEVPDDESLFDK